MANVFKDSQDVNEHPNRNNFDKSFQNNMTLKMGTLYPFLCQEAVPGDSFQMSVDYGLKFMPMPFPVQSRMKAYFYYFWVPNRIMWPESKSFLQGLKDNSGNEIVHPYIDQDSDFFKSGSLADYLGVPSTVVTSEVGNQYYHALLYVNPNARSGSGTGRKIVRVTETEQGDIAIDDALISYDVSYSTTDPSSQPVTNTEGTIIPSIQPQQSSGSTSGTRSNTQQVTVDLVAYEFVSPGNNHAGLPTWLPVAAGNTQYSNAYGCIFRLTTEIAPGGQKLYFKTAYHDLHDEYVTGMQFTIGVRYSSGQNSLNTTTPFVDIFNGVKFTPAFDGRYYFGLTAQQVGMLINWQNAQDNDTGLIEIAFISQTTLAESSDRDLVLPYGIIVPSVVPAIMDADRLHPDAFRRMRINALPFRAYEMCYNSFFRNTQNQPFRVNGHVQYNKYVTTEASGADTTPYHLYERNWELDFLTSALPSPQQGVAPLVGLTQSTFEVSVVDADGVVTNAQLNFNTDGETHTANVSIHNPGESIENDRTLSQVAMAAAGMSINDFRNVNALQHWLETNLRKGFRYVDFIEGHFGQAPKHTELDMPVFLGGFNEIVNVDSITQTSTGDADNPLGSFAGQANLFGSSKSIKHYCDDYGYVIGLMCVVPTPAYSQLLPKHFLKHDPLDYYFHEFAQLGMQPIPYGEVCPLQTIFELTDPDDADEQAKKLHETFGYQRPNYDMCASVDEVHGQFRIDETMRNMLINRVFATRPELGDSFLKINPADTQNIFAYQAPDGDNIVGQIRVNVQAKRPLPRIHMPSLGR